MPRALLRPPRNYIEFINAAFLNAGGSPDEYRAGNERAIAKGWPWRHKSGGLREIHGSQGRAVRLRIETSTCNLYSTTTNQTAITALFRVINRYVGNLPLRTEHGEAACSTRPRANMPSGLLKCINGKNQSGLRRRRLKNQ
jgi:hypothetical protein